MVKEANISQVIAKHDTSLTSLDLGKKLRNESELKKFIAELTSYAKLTQLDLSANDIDDAGIDALALVLNQHKTLTKLNLSFNHFTDAGFDSLVTTLTKNNTLTALQLCAMPVRWYKLQAVGSEIAAFDNMGIEFTVAEIRQKLQAAAQAPGGMGPHAIAQLEQLLLTNNALIELDILGNDYFLEQALNISDLLAANFKLRLDVLLLIRLIAQARRGAENYTDNYNNIQPNYFKILPLEIILSLLNEITTTFSSFRKQLNFEGFLQHAAEKKFVPVAIDLRPQFCQKPIKISTYSSTLFAKLVSDNPASIATSIESTPQFKLHKL